MPLVFACIAPHSPLLISTIAKDNSSQLTKTLNSLNRLKEDLYVARADTVIIISPHGPLDTSNFTINLSPEYSANFEKFGDYSTRSTYNSDIALTYQMRENLEDKLKVQLITDANLDYGCSVPLHHLINQGSSSKIIPVYDSNGDLQSHFEFGKLLQREIAYSNKRIAVIASADLSHRLSKNSPAGFSPKAEKFDAKVVEIVTKNATSDLFTINLKAREDVAECGLRSIAVLLGILNNTKNEVEKLCYEAPFGVGYLTVNFQL